MHKFFDIGQPQAIEYHHKDRHFESDTEGKEHAQHEAEIAVNIRRKVHGLWREAGDELEDHAEDDEIAISHTHGKHRHTRHDNGQHQALFITVKRRCDVSPHLIEHKGKRDYECHKECDLQGHHERGHHPRCQKFDALRQRHHERLRQVVENLLHERRQAGKYDEYGQSRTHRTVAQLNQMRDQRLFVGGVFGPFEALRFLSHLL